MSGANGPVGKTYQIEIQRLKALTHNKAGVDIRMDALVLPSPKSKGQGDRPPGTVISLSEADARSLFVLLKAKLAELDGKKPPTTQR